MLKKLMCLFWWLRIFKSKHKKITLKEIVSTPSPTGSIRLGVSPRTPSPNSSNEYTEYSNIDSDGPFYSIKIRDDIDTEPVSKELFPSQTHIDKENKNIDKKIKLINQQIKSIEKQMKQCDKNIKKFSKNRRKKSICRWLCCCGIFNCFSRGVSKDHQHNQEPRQEPQ